MKRYGLLWTRYIFGAFLPDVLLLLLPSRHDLLPLFWSGMLETIITFVLSLRSFSLLPNLALLSTFQCILTSKVVFYILPLTFALIKMFNHNNKKHNKDNEMVTFLPLIAFTLIVKCVTLDCLLVLRCWQVKKLFAYLRPMYLRRAYSIFEFLYIPAVHSAYVRFMFY